MASFRLEQLFKGHLTQSLTQEEKSEFFALVNDASHADQLQELVDRVELGAHELVDLNEESSKEILFAILTLNEQTTVRNLWWRYVAAACIIALMAIGTIWLISPNQQIQQGILQKAVIAPGTNKAILVTGDGQELVLDGKGTIQVGNARIEGGVASYQNASTVAFNTLKTPRGGQFKVILPDGTHVWINSASQLRYPTAFTGNNRIVELEGEAYFEVTHDRQKPFKVKVGDLFVNVLGTKFNIMAYSDEPSVQTTLVNGSVELNLLGNSKLIQPGEQANIKAGSSEFIIANPDLNQVLAWKEGKFLFNNLDIKSIMRQISRWYDIDVEYRGEPSVRLLGGGFSKASIADSVLSIIEETGIAQFKFEGKKVIVIPKN